ncbi:histidine phosphatase family protein [Cytobacillus spongiae]|uniref:histidine phosphatase family protein n=1 Tax=Cytobacillus spongiae TaxID=2901381 RepID=UPI001F261761|nr:histidine phosphatase family protein [Cytobacillus spongiae]UII54750.1 histidine phosphatase family protein [Cytobacillus spongiae]
MKKIYVVRHAKAEGQPFEAALTEKGARQAEELVGFFSGKKIDRIYSSPFIRAVHTIKHVAEAHNLEIIEDDRLGERVLSEGPLEDWLEKLKASFEDFTLFFNGGESNKVAMERAQSIIKEVLEQDASDIVLVSHGNLSTLLLRSFDERYGFDSLMALSNPDVFEILIEDNENTTVSRIWDDRC